MMKTIIYICMLLAFFIIQGCVCRLAYEFDGGRNYKEFDLKYRFGPVPISEAGLELDVCSNRSGIEIKRTYYSPVVLKDSLRVEKKVIITAKIVSFPDGTVLEQKSRPMGINTTCYDKEKKEIPCLEYYYTCNDFNKKLKKFKHLNLKVNYDLDSLGVITHHEKEYVLVRKKYCQVAVH